MCRLLGVNFASPSVHRSAEGHDACHTDLGRAAAGPPFADHFFLVCDANLHIERLRLIVQICSATNSADAERLEDIQLQSVIKMLKPVSRRVDVTLKTGSVIEAGFAEEGFLRI